MKSKLIVALDVDSYDQATRLVEELKEVVEVFKVGSQLFTRVGPKIVDFINRQERRCFLDLKFHDIPNTVAKAVESAAALRVLMLTLHTAGGEEMLGAAASATGPGGPVLIGVTVLTSVAGNVESEVLARATLAKSCGLAGVVASPREIKPLRQTFGNEFLIITPGIRPAWAEAGDQKRVMTPAEASAAGADFIVVGRPIIAAEQPAAALKVLTEMASAFS